MSSLLDQFQGFISDEKLFQRKDRLLLTCSGGLDSMVLFHLLLQSGYEFEVAHFNYQLRGDASKEDEQLVKSYCQKHKIRFHLKKAGPDHHPVSGIQAWARTLRYSWFKQLLLTQRLDFILTAHHQDDSMESFLINLLRGSGTKGLGGIHPIVNIIRRPLLFTDRSSLYRYALENKVSWRDDVSNEQLKYNRNKIRHLILPELKAIRGNLSGLKNSMEILTETEEYLQQKLAKDLLRISKVNKNRCTVDLALLKRQDKPSFLLFQLLDKYNMGRSQVQSMLSMPRNGSCFYSNTHEATIRDDQLFIRPILLEDQASILVDLNQLPADVHLNNGRFRFETRNDVQISDDQGTISVDLAKIMGPLSIRKWKNGDIFKPIGMGGKRKKVKHLFQDHKLNKFQKEESWIIEDAQHEIIWVAPYRSSETSKISKQTTNLLVIQWIED
jgi:tRNA(Ile)-lysidine synthase